MINIGGGGEKGRNRARLGAIGWTLWGIPDQVLAHKSKFGLRSLLRLYHAMSEYFYIRYLSIIIISFNINYLMDHNLLQGARERANPRYGFGEGKKNVVCIERCIHITLKNKQSRALPLKPIEEFDSY